MRLIPAGRWPEEARASQEAIYHVYVLQEGDDGATKIGIARNAFWRRRDLQSGNPRPLTLRAVYESDREHARRIEAAVLSELSDSRISGEWLDVSPAVVIGIIDRATHGSD